MDVKELVAVRPSNEDACVDQPFADRALRIVICLTVSAAYFIFSLQFAGPAYLADEIGYLNSAAFIAGYFSDGASSYYAGYSLIISPLFWLFSDPHRVWLGVLLANALMWGATLFLAGSILDRLVPEATGWRRTLALLVIAAYPAYPTMSGYAFAQTAFALVFALLLYSLFRVRSDRVWSVVPHSILVGYLCAIHPSGLAVAVASVIAVSYICWRERSWSIACTHILTSGLLVLAYQLEIRPWMVTEMTPSGGVASLHYPGLLAMLRGGDYMERLAVLLGMAFGQLSYLLISTFGFLAVGAVTGIRGGLRKMACSHPSHGSRFLRFEAAVPFVLVLSVLGIIALSALGGIAGSGPNRIDHWIYGRYAEPVIPVLLGIGLLSATTPWIVATSALVVVMTGALLVHGLNISGPIYAMNVPALWPQFAYIETTPLAWFVIGAVGLVAVSMFHRMIAALAIVVVYLFCMPPQVDWHKRVLAFNSTPSDIPQFVANNFPDGSCVAFDDESGRHLTGVGRERGNLYSFYLFDSPMIRMTPRRWLDECDGPLLTFNPSLSAEGAHYVGREISSGLYIVVKAPPTGLVYPESGAKLQYWLRDQSADCLIAGCFSLNKNELNRYSLVGASTSQGLESDGRAGYLLYGPYAKLAAGDYVIELEGRFDGAADAKFDVTSSEGGTHAVFDLLDGVDLEGSRIMVPISLSSEVSSLEVRIHVSERDRILVSGYQLYLASEFQERIPPIQRKSSLRFSGEGLRRLPSQIGKFDGGALRSGGMEGFLAYGPYRALPAGKYKLTLNGALGATASGWLDVASNAGQKTHFHAALPNERSDASGVLLEADVMLQGDVNDLEVRIFSAGGASLDVTSYSLEPLQGNPPAD